MPERTNGHNSRVSMGKLALCLTLLGLLVVCRVIPSITHYRHKTSTSPSALLRMPNSRINPQKNAISLNRGHSSSGIGKLFVDRVHPRLLNPVNPDDDTLSTSPQICPRDQVSCGARGHADDGPDDDENYRKRSPLKWTKHRGPPIKHNSPKTATYTKARPVALALQDSQKGQTTKSLSAGSDLVERTTAETPGTAMNLGVTIPNSSAPQVPSERAAGQHHDGSNIIEQTADRDPHTSMTHGIDRPKPPDRTVTKVISTNDDLQHADKKGLLNHSKSTSNQNLLTRRETVSVTSDKKQVEAHHSELVPRRLICDCGPYICTNYRNLCNRWMQVPDRKRSVFHAPNIPGAEADHNTGNAEVTLAQRISIPTPGAKVPSPTKGSVSGEKHYIPAYWRSNEHGDSSTALKPNRPPHSEKVSRQEQHNLNSKNSTHARPNDAPGVAVADAFVPKKCSGTTKELLNQCQSTHQAAIIFYSLLGVFVTSILLLGLLRCYMCLRRRRNVAKAKNIRARLYEKSGASPGESLSSKRETQSNNVDGSRHYMNMDGAEDNWPGPEHRRTWNIFSRNRRVPGRFSPIPQVRTPRISTLKLPKPVFATVRKVSGIGFEGMLVSYKKGFKGTATNISRIKWSSTV